MPDFDVQVLGLTSPAANAPVTTYTPALSVRNNGLKAAVVTGVLRIYEKEAPGQLLATQQLTPKSVAAGATADVYSALTWTPTEEQIGTSFIFTADITAADDQVETNNHLNPTFVTIVEGEPPPPPPVVTAHAAQHQQGGNDELDVTGMPGELADDQPAKDHAGKHEQGGADELSLAGLHGVAADAQTPAAHANEKHSTAFATETKIAEEISDHDDSNTAHAASAGLEHTAKKNANNGYLGLDGDGQVPIDRLYTSSIYYDIVPFRDGNAGDVTKLQFGSHIHRGPGGLCARTLYACTSSEVVFMKKAYPASFFGSALYYTLDLSLGFLVQATAGDVLTIYVRASAASALIGTHAITFPNLNASTPGHLRMLIAMVSGATNCTPHYSGNVRWNTIVPGAIGGANVAGAGTAFAHAGAGDITVAAKWTGLQSCIIQCAHLVEACDLVDDNV
jgi:hypothetical protein